MWTAQAAATLVGSAAAPPCRAAIPEQVEVGIGVRLWVNRAETGVRLWCWKRLKISELEGEIKGHLFGYVVEND